MNRQKSAEEENDGSRGRSLLQKLSPRSLKSDSMSKKRSGSLSSTGSSRSERARSLSQSLSPRRALKGKTFEEKNPDEQDLHVSDAAMLAKLPALKKRIEKGFDIHKKDKYGRSVLIYPVLRGQLEVTEYLIKEQNMDPNALCNKGRNALHWLATSGSPNSVRIFRLLHEKGVEINRQDEDGNTPLMIACLRPSNVKFIQALCFHGAKKNFKNKQGKNAVQAAHEACGPVWALEVQKLLKHRPPGEALKAKKRIVKVPPVEETKDATTEWRISGLLDEEQAKLACTGSQVSLESFSTAEENEEDDLNQEKSPICANSKGTMNSNTTQCFESLCSCVGDDQPSQQDKAMDNRRAPRYSGQWKGDKINGKGTYYYADGARYKGEFVENKMHGYGEYFYVNGDRYEGQWKDGKRNGQGTYYRTSGNRYEGQWKDERINGQGTLYHANGARHEGQYQNGKANGQGTLYYANGDRLIGNWQYGKKQGEFTIIRADGSRSRAKYVDDAYDAPVQVKGQIR